MLGLRYLKVPATTYVMQYKGGKIQQQGAGLSFWYFAPTSVIAQVPINSVDVPFAFTEVSSDFQDVTVQGNLTYRVTQPEELASLLDYSVDAHGRYLSDDPGKLSERLVQTSQRGARGFVQSHTLKQVLVAADELVTAITEAFHASTTMTKLGVEVLEVGIASLKADPEMSKALQAEAREELLKKADEAVYARRNTAVELERTIRENELQTEIAVTEKQREVHESEMAGQIAIEEQRTALGETKVANETKEAEARGAALAAMLQPVRDLDWKTLLAIQGEGSSRTLVSAAFEELARNAQKIGNLNISPDLLDTLLNRED